MAITKIQSGAIPADTIDTTHIGDVGADKITGQVVSSQISDLGVTHAKLHTTMDLSSKTVTLPSLSQTIVNSSHIQMGGNLDVVGQIGAYDNPGSSWGKMILRATDFELKNAGGTINMVLDTSGNVGIGTSSPQGLIDLTVSQAKTATSGATFARLGKTNEGSNYASLNCEIKGGASAADRKWSFQTVEQGVANAGSILFQPDGGNVGIGTSSIAANTKLIVKAATDQNLEVEYTSGKLRLSALNDARSANVPLQFTSTSFEFLSGNVGIGTNSPARILHVKDASEANIRIQGGSDYAELRVKDSDDKFSMHYGGSQVIALDSNEIFFHKNVSAIGTQGAYFNSNYSHITTTNDSPLTLNRLGNNNNLNYALDVRKDSSNAGGLSVQDTWNSTKTSSFHPMSSHTYGYGLHGLNLHGYDVGRLDQSNTFNGDDQSGATMPGIVGTNPKNMKYFALYFQVVGDNVYYPFMINMNDVKGVLEIVGGDASSRGYKRWYVNFTSTAYGVYGITEAESVGGGWNSGSFSARHEAPNGKLAVGFKFSSYYSSTNVASFKAIWRAM